MMNYLESHPETQDTLEGTPLPANDLAKAELRKGPEEGWADTQWFQVWLRLARHEYQGQPDVSHDCDSFKAKS